MYFATLNFQQVSQVENSGCLMWRFQVERNVFFSYKNPIKSGTPCNQYKMIIIIFSSSKVLRVFNYSWNLFLVGECYNLWQDNMGGNCCTWNIRFRLDY